MELCPHTNEQHPEKCAQAILEHEPELVDSSKESALPHVAKQVHDVVPRKSGKATILMAQLCLTSSWRGKILCLPDANL